MLGENGFPRPIFSGGNIEARYDLPSQFCTNRFEASHVSRGEKSPKLEFQRIWNLDVMGS